MVGRGNGKSGLVLDEFIGRMGESKFINWDDVVLCGKAYPIDEYDLRFVYTEDNVEATHFILEKRKRSDKM